MSKKVFVGGLSWNTDEEGLRQAFERFGGVNDVRVITDRESGRSRGFGFVTFDDDDAANQSISELDGTELDGRQIKVNLAQERQPRSGGHGGGHGGGRSSHSGSSRGGSSHAGGNRW